MLSKEKFLMSDQLNMNVLYINHHKHLYMGASQPGGGGDWAGLFSIGFVGYTETLYKR